MIMIMIIIIIIIIIIIKHRNLAVAYYDYQKDYDRIHHDWTLKVYRWIGVPDDVSRLIEEMMNK